MATLWKEAVLDDKFIAGEQWPEALRKQREEAQRPCPVVNRVNTLVDRLTNENRQLRPAIRTRPVDSGADVETSQVKNGLLQHIAYHSDSETAYDTAVGDAIRHGFGFFRVLTQYSNDKTFDQEIRVDRILDSFSILFPVHLCKKVDWSDAPYAFVISDLTREDFDAKYPGEFAGDWMSEQARATGWVDEKMVRVAEYWERSEEKKTIYMLEDGTVTDVKPLTYVKTRSVDVPKWTAYILTSGAVLDTKEWPVKYLPIIPVLGKEMIVDGELRLISLTRFARDPQQLYNYWRACEAETISLSSKAPVVGVKGQFEGFENRWRDCNRINYAYLEYNPVTDAAGTVFPPPQRITAPQIPSGYVNAAREASDDIKSVVGIFDASVGASGNETSGRAIIARQRQSDVANFHFADNLAKSLRQAGRVILELIPIIYDTARQIHILGEDKQDKVVSVNARYQDNGKEKYHDMGAGTYDVVVDTGPAYQSQREEAVQSMLELIKMFPPAAQVSADLLVENLDVPGASDIAARLRRAMPPALLEDKKEEAGATEKDVQAMAADMQKALGMIKGLEGALQETTQLIENQQAERALKMNLALLKSETDLQLARLRQGEKVEDAISDLRARYTQQVSSPAPVAEQQTGLSAPAPEFAGTGSAPVNAEEV
jgi:hypothetical protein